MTTPTNRGQPANLEAEEAVLACCILDPEWVDRARDMGLDGSWFYRPAHQTIWRGLCRLTDTGAEVDEITLAHELHRLGELDSVGGHAEINRLTIRMETSAHARHYLEIVKDAALRRKVISAASQTIESAHGTADLPEVLDKAETHIAGLISLAEPDAKRPTKRSQRERDRLCRLADSVAFDPANPKPKLPPVLCLGGKPVLHSGNFLAILAPKSSGKSSTVAACLASLVGPEGPDYLGWSAPASLSETAVIHCDTEQSGEDHDAMMQRSLRRAKLTTFPSWVTSYHLRRFEPRKRLAMLLALARREHERNGLRLVIMDGLVDFLRDFNDVGESTDLINKLMELIDETGCAVLPTLHVNPGQKRGESSDKGRGHLGTIFEQKAETILLLKKKQTDNKEVISLSTKDARHGLGAGIQFAWDEDAKMHLQIRENLTPLDSLGDGMSVLARDAFDGWEGGAMPYTILVERIEKSSGCSRRTAVRRLNDLMAEGLVEKTDGGLYQKTI